MWNWLQRLAKVEEIIHRILTAGGEVYPNTGDDREHLEAVSQYLSHDGQVQEAEDRIRAIVREEIEKALDPPKS